MKKVITIGGVTQDIFIQYEHQKSIRLESKNYTIFEEGRKLEVTDVHYALGGGAANTALTFKRLGLDVFPVGKIGTDAPGSFVRTTLESLGIPTRYIAQDATVQTATSFILPAPSGDRTILAYRGANAELTEKEIPADIFASADYTYISSLAKKSSHLFSALCKSAKNAGNFVAANPGLHQLSAYDTVEALGAIDLFALNMFEAQTFMNMLGKKNVWDLTEYCATIHAYGPTLVIVTHGAHGVYVSTKDKEYFAPSIPTKVVNTVGAGDAFTSCFVGMLALGNDIQTALRAGLINSSCVLRHTDAQHGICEYEDLQKKLAEYPIAVNSK